MIRQYWPILQRHAVLRQLNRLYSDVVTLRNFLYPRKVNYKIDAKKLNLDIKPNELQHGLALIWFPFQSYAHRPMETAAWPLQICAVNNTGGKS